MGFPPLYLLGFLILTCFCGHHPGQSHQQLLSGLLQSAPPVAPLLPSPKVCFPHATTHKLLMTS